MWILTKDGMMAVDTAKILRIYVAPSSPGHPMPAVRCCYSATTQDVTLGAYCTEGTAKAVLKTIVKKAGIIKDGDYEMPDDEEASKLAESYFGKPRERAADGKKTVRRGGS